LRTKISTTIEIKVYSKENILDRGETYYWKNGAKFNVETGEYSWYYYSNSTFDQDMNYYLILNMINNKSLALLNIRNDSALIRLISEEIIRGNRLEINLNPNCIDVSFVDDLRC
jgi:hypothetical protein